MHLLGESTQDLLQANADALQVLISWLKRLNHERKQDLLDRFFRPRAASRKSQDNAITFEDAINTLQHRIDIFKAEQRLRLLEPYKAAGDELALDVIPHRYLYQALVHQYHLSDTAQGILNILREVSRICRERALARFWFPDLPKLWRLDVWMEVGEDSHDAGDEDPSDLIGGASTIVDLGVSKPRNPDALEPETVSQKLAHSVFAQIEKLFRGNVLFAWKAAVLTALLSIPTYLRSSAEFMYVNKAIWSIFMAQLVSGRLSSAVSRNAD